MKLVIFDCDGTLVDSQHMIVAAMQESYRSHQLRIPERKRLLSIVGLSLHQAFEQLGEGEANFPVASMVDQYKAAFFALRAADHHLEPLFPGAREVVEALSARPDVLLGIATGKGRRGVEAVLSRHDLLDRFHTIKTADDAPSKPHPGMVLDATREAGVAPAHTIVVGNTVFDMAMAQAAGASAIGVAWGYHPPASLHGAGALAVIEEFSALLPTLERAWAARAARAGRQHLS